MFAGRFFFRCVARGAGLWLAEKAQGSRPARPGVHPRAFATLGFVLVALMGLVFTATGGDRGPLYVGVNALGTGAAGLAALGAWRRHEGLWLLGAGLAMLALVRLLNVVLDLTRIALPVSLLMLAGWSLAAGGVFAHAASRRPRGALVAFGLYLAAAAYAWALVGSLGSGRLSAVGGILLGTVGLLVAAPDFTASPSG